MTGLRFVTLILCAWFPVCDPHSVCVEVKYYVAGVEVGVGGGGVAVSSALFVTSVCVRSNTGLRSTD